MERVKYFILDNLRYILSGILLILIVVILVKCTGDGEKEPGQEDPGNVIASQEEPQTPQEPIAEPEPPANDLVQDAYPEVNALVQAYFDAKAAGDVEALRRTVNELGDQEADSVSKMSEHIEGYNNITCYTKFGPAQNSYVAYVCYDIKFKNVDTMAPSLNMFYVCTAEDGSLYINNGTWDAETEAAIVELNSGADVQALVTQVEEAYNAALAQDEKLSNLASTLQSAQAPAEEAPAEETPPAEENPPAEGQAPQGETVYAKETVNVRSQADEGSERVGQIAQGDSATRLGEDGNGWSQIDYNGTTAYVKSEFLTTNQEEAAAANTAGAPASGAARIVETAKMRAGEDTGSELLDTLFPGTEIEVVENYASGRSKITYDGKTGYVNTECIGE